MLFLDFPTTTQSPVLLTEDLYSRRPPVTLLNWGLLSRCFPTATQSPVLLTEDLYSIRPPVTVLNQDHKCLTQSPVLLTKDLY